MTFGLPKGIINMGTTCFLNAVLQSIFNMNHVILLFLKTRLCTIPEDKKKIFQILKHHILQYYYKKSKNIHVLSIYKSLPKYLQDIRIQQDADECMNFPLNEIMDIFKHKNLFLIETKQINIKKKEIQKMKELSLYLDIPDKKNVTMFDCIQTFLNPFGTNQNDKRMYIENIGNYMVVTLKRFIIDKNNKYIKSNKRVEPMFSFSIDTSKLILTTVIIHEGTHAGSGHYVSCIKKNKDWFLCNDQHISSISFETLKQKIAMGYVFIYQKI